MRGRRAYRANVGPENGNGAPRGANSGSRAGAPLTFGRHDLRTCYMGSLAMPRLLTFRAPVAGLPLAHLR
ncbi:hypothetical protein [Sorangium sp. So ce362]|uniref:hypothetical protein n=1 Tax=Sorangium sp. So ce362 TaxID=3133303 RepID=UPI003F60E925